MEPNVGAIDQYDSDPWCKEGKNPSRLVPFWTEQNPEQVPPHQRESGAEPHSDESNDGNGFQIILPESIRVLAQRTERGNSNGSEGSRQQAHRHEKQIIGAFIMS